MRARSASGLAAFVALIMATAAIADDKTEYERRAVERDVALFQSLDRNRDNAVTKLEAQGDLNFGPRFDDMDINRDNIVTREELQRYLEQQYGVRTTAAAGSAPR